jgi:hypothetical protein
MRSLWQLENLIDHKDAAVCEAAFMAKSLIEHYQALCRVSLHIMETPGDFSDEEISQVMSDLNQWGYPDSDEPVIPPDMHSPIGMWCLSGMTVPVGGSHKLKSDDYWYLSELQVACGGLLEPMRGM